MRIYRIVSVACIVCATVFLYGFNKSTKKHSLLKSPPIVIKQKAQKPLDLAIPAEAVSLKSYNDDLTTEQQSELVTPEIFDMQHNRKMSPLEMKGQVIMSQEPEAGKLKSADGAGILINLHH